MVSITSCILLYSVFVQCNNNNNNNNKDNDNDNTHSKYTKYKINILGEFLVYLLMIIYHMIVV